MTTIRVDSAEARLYAARVPTIFEQDGYRFFFYSNDHEPAHVHVRRGGGEAVFEITDEVELRESSGLKVRELARAQQLAEENKRLILQKWHEYLA
ncbi:MAG: DUF4160 domain-containing protein [Verrucomicrobiota bacterium]|nr:DUF4160 domain-containing protein [Verrucomicrobiota bacterium]